MALVLVHVLDNFVGELIRRIGKHESLISTIVSNTVLLAAILISLGVAVSPNWSVKS